MGTHHMKFDSVGVIGGGAWGTALAQTMALAGRDVCCGPTNPTPIREINEHHINRVFPARSDDRTEDHRDWKTR